MVMLRVHNMSPAHIARCKLQEGNNEKRKGRRKAGFKVCDLTRLRGDGHLWSHIRLLKRLVGPLLVMSPNNLPLLEKDPIICLVPNAHHF